MIDPLRRTDSEFGLRRTPRLPRLRFARSGCPGRGGFRQSDGGQLRSGIGGSGPADPSLRKSYDLGETVKRSLYLDLKKGCPVWRSLSSVGASIGDPFEGAGIQVLSWGIGSSGPQALWFSSSKARVILANSEFSY